MRWVQSGALHLQTEAQEEDKEGHRKFLLQGNVLGRDELLPWGRREAATPSPYSLPSGCSHPALWIRLWTEAVLPLQGAPSLSTHKLSF